MATLVWDRNSESDMKDYRVYACFTAGCILMQSPSMLVGTVTQTATGVLPSFVIDVTGKEGKVAISSRDQSLNESGLSVAVPFDFLAPVVPLNPRFQ